MVSSRLEQLYKHGAVIALVALVVFGALRYDNFLSLYNVMSVCRNNAMYALVALGMCFVIMTGGIDLSVGAVAACASVAAAKASPYGLVPGLAAGVGVGLAAGIVNSLLITRARLLPFIATLVTMLAADGCALLLADNQSIAVSYTSGFIDIGQGDVGPFPIPAVIALALYALGSLVLNRTSAGRSVLATGGGEEASRLMGLRPDTIKFAVYAASGALAGLAGVLLAAEFGAGQPTEGVGWELFAIASVVIGGTLLSGGAGSVFATLAGVLLMGTLFTVLNFENGLGVISLSAYWQSVIRGLMLLAVVVLQATVTQRRRQKHAT
ncbi:ABC transporter permease [Pararobbsia silviterrae]|uniref:ABC transporter permease n=1 Tax=Pararobbsia silviterrae TaxID=1792498 RepID=A0A494XQ72_9BURK|nr:ABC transporter permease [Pararobbsia silviterrae]RKP51851.1 ABC transporter permease [Pararobbsia silviterrae]